MKKIVTFLTAGLLALSFSLSSTAFAADDSTAQTHTKKAHQHATHHKNASATSKSSSAKKKHHAKKKAAKKHAQSTNG